MMPPKPPRTKLLKKSTITSSDEVLQSVHKEPDATMPAVTDGIQSEVKVKPVPRPRSKIQPKSQRNNSNNSSVDSADTTSNTTNAESSQLSEDPADYEASSPVHPPPRPPLSKCMTSRKLTAAVDGGNHYMNSVYEPTVRIPAVSTERTQSPPTTRPERPPPPSISYSARSTMKLKSEDTDETQQSISYSARSTMKLKDTDETQQSSCSSISYSARSTMKLKSEDTDESKESSCSYIGSMPPSPVSPTVSQEEVNLCGTFTCTKAAVRPAVPPRVGQSSLPCSVAVYDASPSQSRPPPPAFTPPPPPSKEPPMDTLYSEIEHRPYLDVLPEDVDKMTQGRPTQRYQTGTPRQQITEDTEDMIGMLRWLKRVSRSDVITSSLYGLSIEEEIRFFNQRAIDVRKALRLYNLLMMKRNESLRNIITEFCSISDSLDKLKKKGKTMDIAGGTTGAVGGMTAVLGIAFAPMTMGASLIATAVGAGMVASAGGIGAHAAKANKKIVNKMAVEKLVYEYKGNVVDPELCLDFILSGMNELRRHDIARLHRAGAQPDALKLAHLSQSVFRNSMNNDRKASVAHTAGMSSERLLTAFAKEIDQYFTEKNGQKLKKSNKSRFSGRVRLLAENLHDELQHLNHMWQMFC